jgi:hypothetical protein
VLFGVVEQLVEPRAADHRVVGEWDLPCGVTDMLIVISSGVGPPGWAGDGEAVVATDRVLLVEGTTCTRPTVRRRR